MKSAKRRTIFTLGAALFLLYLCIHFWPSAASFIGNVLTTASPIFVGAVVAYIVNLLMRLFEACWFPKSQKKLARVTRRPVCMLLSYLSFLLVVGLVSWLVVPQLISCIQLLIGVFPGWMEKAVDFLQQNRLLSSDLLSDLNEVDWSVAIREALSFFNGSFGGIMNFLINTVSTAVSTIINSFLSFIFSLYFLLERDKLVHGCRRLVKAVLPESGVKKTFYLTRVFHESFRGYIIGQSLEAIILGVLCAIGMLIFRFPYVAMVSALIAFTALIPVAGAYIGAGVGAFMILTVSPVKALLFLVFIIVLQQLEGNLIYPKVVGTSLGLPGLWVLAAVVIGGGIMGVTGMFLGVPFAGALYRIVKDFVKKREEKASQKAKTLAEDGEKADA